MAEVEAKMATVVASRAPDVLIARGIGSCLVVTAYSKQAGIGGMLHAMLPKNPGTDSARAKYVDSGIDELFSRLGSMGVPMRGLEVKMAGAANMFPTLALEKKVEIGDRNIQTAREKFKKLGVFLSGEDVGGTHGRTITLNLSNGRLEVRASI